ncbi:MAG: winged helix-turn-helix domain-containing protein [Chloroflexi bacterium]|nr:winged helix-turn-helix domain-containing protein [Chloroflexota bacterium]
MLRDEIVFQSSEKFIAPSMLMAFPGKEDIIQPAKFCLMNDVATLGRSLQCDIVVESTTVPRLHAKVERDGPRYLLSDSHSANGTFVNGRHVREPHVLQDEDRIGLSKPAPLLFFVDANPTEFISGQLRYDAPAMTFFLNEKPLDLTPAQFRLLFHLYEHVGDVCTRESCAEALWGRDYDPRLDAEALDRAISKLRHKLREIRPEADMLKTARGLGYVLDQ